MQVTYDIYKPHFKPSAGGKHLLVVSRIMVAIYGLVMACVSVIFYKVSHSKQSAISRRASKGCCLNTMPYTFELA